MSQLRIALLAFAVSIALVPPLARAQTSHPSSAPASAAPFLDSGSGAWVDRQFDFVHVDFDLAFDLEKRSVKGRVSSAVLPLLDGLRELSLDAGALRVLRATVNEIPVQTRIEPGKLILALVKPTKLGEKLDVVVDYECNPVSGLHWGAPEPGYEWKGFQCYSQGQAQENHHWLPTHDYPNDRVTWSCTLHVPTDLTAVSNGAFLGVQDDAGGLTRAWKYSMDKPNCTYLISVAIGPWERFADEWKGIPVEYFVARGQGEERARLAFGKTPQMIDFFSRWIGVDYPWQKYSQTAVMEFVVGGMENVSATTQTDTTLHDERSHLERDSEDLVSHELAHQWWGDYLTCNGWRHLWLNEGFATYFTGLWLENSRGLDDYRLYMDNQRRSFLAADSVDAPRSLVTTPNNRRGDGSNAHVYTKGSSVLHMLRFVLGDENFHRSISLYAKRHGLGLVETRDLERAVADATGRGLEWFWQEWVYLQGAPNFDVKHSYDAEKGMCQVQVQQTQKVSPLVPLFKMPVDLLFVFPDERKELKRIWIDKADQQFDFAFATRPLFVRFDEGSWLACRWKHARSPEELAAQAVLDPDVAGRKEACERLGELNLTAPVSPAIDALVKVLQGNDHRDVRVAAASALRTSNTPASVKELTAALRDAHAPVRRTAADALSEVKGDPAVVEALKAVVNADPAYSPRAAAIRSLGNILGPDAWDFVLTASSQSSEREVVKNAALETLKKLDEKRALPLLFAAARSGEPYESRERALSLLTAVLTDEKSAAAAGADSKALLGDALRAAAGSNNWRFRLAALRALGQLDEPQDEQFLETVVKNARDPRDQRTAQASLASRKARREKAVGKGPSGG